MAKRYKSPITYRLREIPVKQIKVWKDAQARKLDREEIVALEIIDNFIPSILNSVVASRKNLYQSVKV